MGLGQPGVKRDDTGLGGKPDKNKDKSKGEKPGRH